MNSKGAPDLNVDYVTYFKRCDVLVSHLKKVHEKRPFDQVAAVAKGGLIVGTYIAYKLDLPLYAVYASSYDKEKQQKKLTTFVPTHIPFCEKTVLLIDDVWHSGATITALKREMEQRQGYVCPATLYRKETTGFYLIDELAVFTKHWLEFWYE